jgi:two-component system, NtrC family, response regulator AtoC
MPWFTILGTSGIDECLSILKTQTFDVLLLDIRMNHESDGLDAIPKILECSPDLPIIMHTSIRCFDFVQKAMRLGAIDYLLKDLDLANLTQTLNRALQKKQFHKPKPTQVPNTSGQKHSLMMIGSSQKMKVIQRSIEKIQKSRENILIFGETGTGKELVARQFRNSAPFLAVDSATIQSSMAESLLFGHEKGAFTGAEKTTLGIFESANGGTVYFDEISNMPLSIQAKLLRVLQEKEISRVGSAKVISLQFRVIAATNQNLDEMVARGEFKADLLQRLNVIPVSLPPLRDRIEDIPQLIEHFAAQQTGEGPRIRFSSESLEILKSYPWPGNVRELANLVAYLSTMTETTMILPADLPEKFKKERLLLSSHETDITLDGINGFYGQISQYESEVLKKEYDRFSGNISRLATHLKMDRSHLHLKLKRLGIHEVRKREPSKNSTKPSLL